MSVQTDAVPDRFIGEKECHHITNLSRTTRMRLRREGLFPDPIEITPGRKAWLLSDIMNWMKERLRDSQSDADTVPLPSDQDEYRKVRRFRSNAEAEVAVCCAPLSTCNEPAGGGPAGSKSFSTPKSTARSKG